MRYQESEAVMPGRLGICNSEMVEPVYDDEEEDLSGFQEPDQEPDSKTGGIVYKRISDVAQTLTEGFNAAVKLARHVATKLTLLQDEEGTYYFSA